MDSINMNSTEHTENSTFQSSFGSINASQHNATSGVDMSTSSDEGDSVMLVGKVLVGVIGLFGNSLVIAVIGSNKKMREKLVNSFFLNQSALDVAVSIFLLIDAVLTYGIKLRARDFSGVSAGLYCRFIQSESILWGFMASSTYNLLALTVERYLEIVKPIWHKIHYTRKVAMIKMAVCWIFGQLYMIGDTATRSGMVDGNCVLFKKFNSQQTAYFWAFLITFMDYILPISVIVACYTGIVVALRSRVDAKREANSTSNIMIRARKNALKTLAIVTACFFACWSYVSIPYCLYRLGFLSATFYGTPIGQLASLSGSINSCINPFIYSLQYKEFQNAMKKLFGFKQQDNPSGNSTGKTTTTV